MSVSPKVFLILFGFYAAYLICVATSAHSKIKVFQTSHKELELDGENKK